MQVNPEDIIVYKQLCFFVILNSFNCVMI